MFGGRGEFTGRHMLFTMLGFFGVIVAVNAAMVLFATSSWTGLIAENTYVASRDFDAGLKRAEAREARGWSSEALLDGRTLSFAVRDAGNGPVTALSVVGRVYRPVADVDDRDVTLTETAPGVYGAPVDLKPGLWEAAISATGRSGEVHERVFRFVVKERPR